MISMISHRIDKQSKLILTKEGGGANTLAMFLSILCNSRKLHKDYKFHFQKKTFQSILISSFPTLILEDQVSLPHQSDHNLYPAKTIKGFLYNNFIPELSDTAI